MLKNIIIVGASGFGREVAWLIEQINEQKATWNILGFIDDCAEAQGIEVGGYKVIGTTESVEKFKDAYFICAIGVSKVRKKVVEKLGNVKFATLIHPSVILSKRVTIGDGTIICAGTIGTVDLTIGNHVIINLDCTVGHDAVLNDYVTLYPSVNMSGMTAIGDCSEVGTGTQIIQGKTIGANSIVGAGSVVVTDIPAKCTAVGSPAKPIKYFD